MVLLQQQISTEMNTEAWFEEADMFVSFCQENSRWPNSNREHEQSLCLWGQMQNDLYNSGSYQESTGVMRDFHVWHFWFVVRLMFDCAN